MPTNGLLPDRTAEWTERILTENPNLRLDLNIALDGLHEMQDSIRAVPGNFAKTLRTIEAIQPCRERFPNRVGERGGSLENMELSLFDPTRPIGSWRTAWRTLTKKAGLEGIRFHDLRHTAISALGEVGVPDRVIMTSPVT